MSKSIYEEAITATNILCANDFDNSPNNPSLNATEILDNFNIINEALKQAQKQEKLLELYRKLSVIRNDLLSYCEVVDDDYNDFEYIEIDLEKKIKELENE